MITCCIADENDTSLTRKQGKYILLFSFLLQQNKNIEEWGLISGPCSETSRTITKNNLEASDKYIKAHQVI